MPVSAFWLVLITMIYPLAVWLGPGQIEPRFVAGLLVLAGWTQLHALKIGGAAGRWWLGGMLLLFILAVWSNGWFPLKLYPVLVNLALLGVFAYSLIFPPSMIERFARIREPDLPAEAIGYTRRVTRVWCVFFFVNGAFAFITALWASPAIWTLYNGLIAYLMMGLLFGGEYFTRWHFKKRLNA
jgi:uncharacterized membrane protein